ncbi:hypothetical protein ACWV26_10600 [Rummeliibacillus sp. JY-2-4R]
MTKIKQLITFLVIANLLSLCFIAYALIQKNTEQEKYFIEEIQAPLIQLQTSINHQNQNRWNNPELVSFQASKIHDSIDRALDDQHFANSKLSANEKTYLHKINTAINKLPQVTDEKKLEWKKKDKKNAITLERTLTHVKLTNQTTEAKKYDQFMKQCKMVAKELTTSKKVQEK